MISTSTISRPIRLSRPNTAAAAPAWTVLLLLAAGLLSSPAAAQETCTDCHDTDADAFAETVHGFLECADCHSGADDLPHSDDVGRVDCAMCHDDVAEDYASSIHGQDLANGSEDVPICATCHGELHTLVPSTDESSPVHPLRLPETCGTCHSDPAIAAKYGIPLARPIEAYRASVHSRTQEAATCNDCHGSHAIHSAADHRSTVYHLNVPNTCGQCHQEIAVVFGASVHGKAATHGAREAPVCTDCHGEHRILSPTEEGSPVSATNLPKMTCGRCHGDVRLAEKYGIDADKVPAYEDSYHGLAMRSGRAVVANCASCHGVHDILPSSDPESHIHESHLAETCGRCHPGAGTRFAIGAVHVLQTEPEHAAVYWVRLIYLWMIYVTIGGMLLHNLLDFYRKWRNGIRHPHPDYVVTDERMMPGFRIAHFLLMTSFAVLVYTGFALKYPESWWAAPLLRWEESFALRGWIHRVAAIVMLVAIGFHLVHLAASRRARSAIAMMRPTWDDVHELREYLLYFFGRLPQRPRTPVLGYPEKLEYIALMWGMLVMTVTGFVLWFENPVLRLLPTWVADISTVIHFYEAVLATLAIVVWHFYFVILDPVVYPMDTAWLTGRSHPGRLAERANPELRAEIMPKPRRRDAGPPPPEIVSADARPGPSPTG